MIVVCISYSWFLSRTIKVNETNCLLIRIFRHGAFDSMDSKEIIGGPKQSVIGQPIYTHFYTMCRPFLVLHDVMKLENQSGKFCSAL